MVDKSSDVLESGLQAKKTDNSAFFLLRHALKLLLKHVLLQVKIMLKIPKINQIHGISISFFPSSDINLSAYFIAFLSPTSQKIHCRDPSTNP